MVSLIKMEMRDKIPCTIRWDCLINWSQILKVHDFSLSKLFDIVDKAL